MSLESTSATSTAVPPVHHSFRAMGSGCAVTVGGPQGCVDRVEARVRALESVWSRFLADSEVSQLNEAAGRPISVSDETATLLRCALQASDRTGGLFDPVVGHHLDALGYDRDRSELAPPTGEHRPAPTRSVRRGRLVVEGHTASVHGGRFDPGGIGKGLAADLAAEELTALGVTGAVVDLGGDIRFVGEPFDGSSWRVHVADPFGERPAWTLRLPSGGAGVATSGVLVRRWHHGGSDRHHVLDPSTGHPVDGDLATVTVVSGAVWWSEALATACLVAGADRGLELLAEAGVAALLVGLDGTRMTCGLDGREGQP